MKCDPNVTKIDGREAGMILRFARDYRGKIPANIDKLIFIHAHDRSTRHYHQIIWKTIRSVIRTSYFRTHDFGTLVSLFLWTRFSRQDDGHVLAVGRYVAGWNLYPFLSYIFANTSMADGLAVQRTWHLPCCSTFFMSPQTLLRRTSEEYNTILDRIHWLATHNDAPVWRTGRLRRQVPFKGDYFLSCLLERSWAFIFTGRADPADVAAPIV
jgi:hypothetical protein